VPAHVLEAAREARKAPADLTLDERLLARDEDAAPSSDEAALLEDDDSEP
jgi:hypothetical protein